MRLATILLFVACAALLTAAAAPPQGRTRRPTPGATPTPTPRPRPTPWPNEPPSVKLSTSTGRVVSATGCTEARASACTPTSQKVGLSAQGTDPDGDTLLYTFAAAVGRLEADGPEATLDLTGVPPGVYEVSVEVDDGVGGIATAKAKINVEHCICHPPPPPPPPCPTVTVSCPEGGHLIYKATVTGGDPNVTPTFKWTATPGIINSGQGTNSINVDARGLSYGVFSATVEVFGYDRSCRTSTSCTLVIEPPISPRKVDEYGDIRFDEEKIRLDQFAAELRNDPSAEGHLLCYGGRRSRAGEAQRRCDRAKNHLVNTRDMDTARIVTVDAGRREGPAVELWLVPSGATPPAASPTAEPMSDR